ncbi:MAG: peptide chain release factor N(5)-glutamine methyltransferase [Aquamicrobium sp.]|uniref:peptide chain release factor N(5)-glutamine methyltransferase n=1 Tax=Mesorhizobium sp. Pch-S TaxID=2082387 RepID=UPI001013C0A4|nr:peptide chain release factor N(5)-glutamine methyltransferase [Mesorhizobium sp. Pch-S]MBR2690219.1 peptide chain release factor N(5)-glutamine methyltransferase [Aquamicrobium sp.]QAZ44085.1 peptide chain release factor N(5)-glutamine methyltransferase [Mesorhizobium sp. Pch-S]
MTGTTLAELLLSARRRLAEAGIEGAMFDARLLVEDLTGTTRTEVITDPGRVIDTDTLSAVDIALARRISGEPVHRILGYREFHGLRLGLSPETLEPRPDTETLVEAVLPLLAEIGERKGRCHVLDLGTGTGAIALALLAATPQARAVGVDISEDALTTAARNARDLGLSERFSAVRSDWFEAISGRFDVIVSNPPYISSAEIGTLQKEVRNFDPLRALDGGADGLDAYRTIAAESARHLEADGLVAVEIGSSQKADVTDIFLDAGFLMKTALRDLAGNDRVLLFTGGGKA